MPVVPIFNHISLIRPNGFSNKWSKIASILTREVLLRLQYSSTLKKGGKENDPFRPAGKKTTGFNGMKSLIKATNGGPSERYAPIFPAIGLHARLTVASGFSPLTATGSLRSAAANASSEVPLLRPAHNGRPGPGFD